MKSFFLNLARTISYGLAPTTISDIQRYRYLSSEAHKIQSHNFTDLSHLEKFRRIQKGPFGTQQIESEFTQAMRKVEELKPSTFVEIGAFQGGTLSLFSQVSPRSCRFLSIDIAFNWPQSLAFRGLGAKGQKVHCIPGDSSKKETIEKTRKWLQGSLIDVLFIDGDHSYEGVKSDYKNYSPWVKRGGLIIFHDIVEDYGTRFGTPTCNYTGGVPKFWSELKNQGFQFEEFVENSEQDGFGIGILIK